jgi:DNA-directed RNA polymerase subunit H (RpoH/RPB5)
MNRDNTHYAFDKAFMQQYKTLLEMLLDRGYDLSGLPGYIPPSAEEKAGKIVINGHINITNNTAAQLALQYKGAELFRVTLEHPEPLLKMMVYYVLPEAESKSASKEKKLLSSQEINSVLTVFVDAVGHDNKIGRLLIIGKSNLAPKAQTSINDHNKTSKTYVQFIPAEKLRFNLIKTRYQPSHILIPRGKARELILEEIAIEGATKSKEELLPKISVNDPLAIYYGLRPRDIVTGFRQPAKDYCCWIVVTELEVN